MDKKEVREKAIRQIFEETSLKDKGYRCTKKSIYKKEGDFKFALNFGSAISPNRLEKVNFLEVRASVTHLGLKKYKKENLNLDDGFIGGGGIANLFKAGPPWISYDLGITKDSYNNKVSEIKRTVETDVFQFFSEFSELQNINKYIWKPCFNLRCLIHLYTFLDEKKLLDDLIAKTSIDRKETFKENYINYNHRLLEGESWIDVNKDCVDGQDSLSLEIANSFFEMGVKL